MNKVMYLLPVLTKFFIELPLLVAVAFPPRPTTSAVTMALLPPMSKKKINAKQLRTYNVTYTFILIDANKGRDLLRIICFTFFLPLFQAPKYYVQKHNQST